MRPSSRRSARLETPSRRLRLLLPALFLVLSVIGIFVCLGVPGLEESAFENSSARPGAGALSGLIAIDPSSPKARSSVAQAGPASSEAVKSDAAASNETAPSEILVDAIGSGEGQGTSSKIESAHRVGRRPASAGQPRAAGASGAAGGRKQDKKRRRSQDGRKSSATSGSVASSAASEESEEFEDSEEGDEDEDDEEEPELGAVVATPVQGKVMSAASRKGLGGVTLQLLVFHPLSRVVGAPQWVVPVTAGTDGAGHFEATLDLPEAGANGGAVIGMILTHDNHQPLAGVPIFRLEPGRPENLGIFWMHRSSWPLTGSIVPFQLAEEARLVDSGGLNPLTWDARIRADILGLFPSYPIADADFELRLARQDGVLGNHRWLSLFSQGAWLGCREARWSEVTVDVNGKTQRRWVGEVRFEFGQDTSLRGSVLTRNGGAISNAVVRTLTAQAEPAQSSVTNRQGQFRFDAPPQSLRGFRLSHPEYVTKEFPYNRRGAAPVLILEQLRPDIPVLVNDSVTGEAITRVQVVLKGAAEEGQQAPQIAQSLASASGEYRFTAPWPIAEIHFSSEGFFPGELEQPNNRPGAPIEFTLVPARIITYTAREAIARNDRWSEHEESSLVTYWANRWLKFEIDYSEEVSGFDFELGVRNHGLVDHQYRFEVRVELDGKRLGVLKILASQTQTQTARLRLPAGVGPRTLRITWLNDRWIPNQLDANIVIDWVKFHQRPLSAEEEAAALGSNGSG